LQGANSSPASKQEGSLPLDPRTKIISLNLSLKDMKKQLQCMLI